MTACVPAGGSVSKKSLSVQITLCPCLGNTMSNAPPHVIKRQPDSHRPDNMLRNRLRVLFQREIFIPAYALNIHYSVHNSLLLWERQDSNLHFIRDLPLIYVPVVVLRSHDMPHITNIGLTTSVYVTCPATHLRKFYMLAKHISTCCNTFSSLGLVSFALYPAWERQDSNLHLVLQSPALPSMAMKLSYVPLRRRYVNGFHNTGYADKNCAAILRSHPRSGICTPHE